MFIDTHAHVNFNSFKDDADDVIKRALSEDTWVINVGSQFSTSRRAVEIAERYSKGVYAAIGLHPVHLAEGIFKVKMDEEEIAFHTKDELFEVELYRKLAESKKVVAVGEVGLDYYYHPKSKTKLEQYREKQRAILFEQIDFAKSQNLPVIFHCRSAHEEMISLLKDQKNLQGVIHCYTGNWQEAVQYMDMGYFLGINGIIFKTDLDEVIKNTPLEKLILETDCPYLVPKPMTGRNEPSYVKYVAQRVAELKGINLEQVSFVTTQNAKSLFGLK